jgi:hypothetical protein
MLLQSSRFLALLSKCHFNFSLFFNKTIITSWAEAQAPREDQDITLSQQAQICWSYTFVPFGKDTVTFTCSGVTNTISLSLGNPTLSSSSYWCLKYHPDIQPRIKSNTRHSQKVFQSSQIS